MSKVYHVGKMFIPFRYVAESLGFPGGIVRIITSEDRLGLDVIIEHPSMPEVHEAEAIPRVDAVIYRLTPETDYVLTGNLVRRFRESCRAFRTIWNAYKTNKRLVWKEKN